MKNNSRLRRLIEVLIKDTLSISGLVIQLREEGQYVASGELDELADRLAQVVYTLTQSATVSEDA